VNLPPPSSAAKHWDLDPNTVFLNHGSFGACPRTVRAIQRTLQDQLEREPVHFMVERYRSLLDDSRRALADFLHCDWTNLAPIANATTAVATILRHLEDAKLLKPGDELLTNDHEYPACQNILRATAARTGASVITATLPFPCTSPDPIAEAILARVTPRTRLVLISHVTSPSALILPVDTLVPALRAKNILTLVDGAHAPGMVPSLSLRDLNPSFYTANCHKWLCTPKGSAFLYVDPAIQPTFHPLVLSNNAERPIPGRHQFLTEFDFLGTTDQTNFMSIAASIPAMRAIASEHFNVPAADAWPTTMQHNHNLAIEGRDILCRTLNITPPAPASMIGSIATIFLPEHPQPLMDRLRTRPTKYHDALQDTLLARHRIQVPVWSIPGATRRTLRISAQIYNSRAQYEYLADALLQELASEREFGS
jgi:isopenicillin-N epimerase